MSGETEPNIASEPAKTRRRPVLLTMLCLVSFVYFGILSLLFLAGMFNSGWITGVTNHYIATGGFTVTQTLLTFSAGFLLHGFAFTGVLLLWKMRRIGYYFLGISCLLIATWQLFNPSTPIVSVAIYIILVFLFGLFYRAPHSLTPSTTRRSGIPSPEGAGKNQV